MPSETTLTGHFPDRTEEFSLFFPLSLVLIREETGEGAGSGAGQKLDWNYSPSAHLLGNVGKFLHFLKPWLQCRLK